MQSLSITSAAIDSFRSNGYLILENYLSTERVEALRACFPKLFAGDFDTGVYPDEWYWREGMSLPDVTRHMSNAWKSDLVIARLALSVEVGKLAAMLTGWRGVRLGQDTIWWKPPRAKAIAYHQDSSFMGFLDPSLTITCWFTLDDTERHAGTLEYVPGSHLWPLTAMPKFFHGPENYRAQMEVAAEAVGIHAPTPVCIEVPAGSCVVHAGEIWHGSGPNMTDDRMRRSIGIHLIPVEAQFSDRAGGYIYRRYQHAGDVCLDESFFPVLWTEDGYRTDWIEGYCSSGQKQPRRTIVRSDPSERIYRARQIPLAPEPGLT